MRRLVGALSDRLRRTWFGSALALLGLAILIVIPVDRHCVGIAAVRGGQGGIFCGWSQLLERPGEPGLALLLLVAGLLIVAPMVFPSPAVLLSTGIGGAAAIVALLFLTSISDGVYVALARLGLDITNEARSGLLALLPACVAWVAAGVRLCLRPV